MRNFIGILLVVAAPCALFLAVIALFASVPPASAYLRQPPEAGIIAMSVDADRLAEACKMAGFEAPGRDSDSIARWLVNAQHAQVVRRMTLPHQYGWLVASFLFLAGGIALLVPRWRAAPAPLGRSDAATLTGGVEDATPG